MAAEPTHRGFLGSARKLRQRLMSSEPAPDSPKQTQQQQQQQQSPPPPPSPTVTVVATSAAAAASAASPVGSPLMGSARTRSSDALPLAPSSHPRSPAAAALPPDPRETRTMSNPEAVGAAAAASAQPARPHTTSDSATDSPLPPSPSPTAQQQQQVFVTLVGEPMPYQVPGRTMLMATTRVGVQYSPGLTLYDVREQICSKRGLAAAMYRFESGGGGHENLSSTLASLGVDAGTCKLRLAKVNSDAPLVLRVLIEDPTSKHAMQTLGIKYEANRTMKEVKEIICSKRQVNPADFQLKFDGADVLCGDETTLGALGISSVRLCRIVEIPPEKAPRTKSRRPYLERKGPRVLVPSNEDIKFTVIDGQCVPTRCSVPMLLQFLIDSFPPDVSTIEEFAFILTYCINPTALFLQLLDIFHGKFPEGTSFQNSGPQIKFNVLLLLRCWIDINFSTFATDSDLFGMLLEFLMGAEATSTGPITQRTFFWSLLGLVHDKMMAHRDLSELVAMMRSDPSMPFMRDPDGRDTTLFFTGWQSLDWLRSRLSLNKSDGLLLGQMLMDSGLLRTNSRTTEFSDMCQLYFQGEGTGMHSRLMDFSAPEFAQQLTLLLSTMLRSIDITTEMTHQAWTRPSAKESSAVVRMLDFQDRLTLWIVAEVINQASSRRRLEAIKRVMQIARECFANNSLGAVQVLTTALQHPSIARMRQIWSALSMRKRESLLTLCAAVSHADGFREYHRRVNTLLHAKQRVPMVPFLDAHLQELRFIESNRTITETGHVDYWKLHQISQVLSTVAAMQDVPYTISFAIVMQRALINAGTCTLTGEELYATSCFVEPVAAEPHPRPFQDMLRSLEHVKLTEPTRSPV